MIYYFIFGICWCLLGIYALVYDWRHDGLDVKLRDIPILLFFGVTVGSVYWLKRCFLFLLKHSLFKETNWDKIVLKGFHR